MFHQQKFFILVILFLIYRFILSKYFNARLHPWVANHYQLTIFSRYFASCPLIMKQPCNKNGFAMLTQYFRYTKLNHKLCAWFGCIETSCKNDIYDHEPNWNFQSVKSRYLKEIFFSSYDMGVIPLFSSFGKVRVRVMVRVRVKVRMLLDQGIQ